MPHLSRILRPALGILLAIAVALGAAVIASRFAAPSTVTTEPEVITAPVLAPAALGDEQPDLGADSPPSEVVAEREVTLPGSDNRDVTPLTRVLLDEMGASPDPLETLRLFEIDAADDTPPTDGDPCAPREGESTADCPDGIESTVLAVVAPRSAGVGAQAFPPTYERYLADGNPYGGSLWCDGLAVGDGDLPFGILASVPGTSTLSFWPTASPEDVTTLPAITAPADEVAAYETALATETTSLDVPLSRVCLVLPDLPASTDYSARVVHTDIFGRSSTSTIERFFTDGAPTRPGALIAALGENFIFASGLHKPDDSVETRAWLVDEVTTASCSGSGSTRELSAVTHAEATVTQDFLSSINSLPEYTGKTVDTFRVPEGATVIVCMRWFPAGDSPSWQRNQHDYESQVVLQSPDRILPVVSLADLRVNTDSVSSARISTSSAEGGDCGYYPTYRSGRELRLPATLCTAGALVEGSTRVDDERIWDLGFSGDLLLSAQIERTSAEPLSASVLVPLSRWTCRGSCELPDTSWYTIHDWAGSGVSTVVRVDWEQGLQNGQRDWNVLPAVSGEVGYVTPSLPQLDTTTPVTVTVNDRTLTAGASILLETDRPVTYTVRLRSDSGGEPCLLDSAHGATRSGSTLNELASVSFSSLCLGAQYQLEAQLTDPVTGVTAVWGLVDRQTWWGSSALFEVPPLDVTVSYRWMAQGVEHSAMAGLRISVAHTDLDAVNERGGSCTSDGIVGGSGNGIEAQLPSWVRVEFAVRLWPSRSSTDDCLRSVDESALLAVDSSAYALLSDLLRPEGVIVDYPEVNGQLQLWAYHP